MIRIEEVLAVITEVGETTAQQPADNIGWQFCGRLASTLSLLCITQHGVIFDIVTIDLNGCFPVFVTDGVAEAFQGFHHFFTNPLAHFRETPKPGVVLFFGGGRDDHRNLLPVVRRLIKRILKGLLKTDKNGFQVLFVH